MKEVESIRKFCLERPDLAEKITTMHENGRIKSSSDISEEARQGELMIIGSPKTDIDGSKQYRCVTCNSILWLVPSTQEMIAQHKGPIHPTCLACFTKFLKDKVNEQNVIQ
jgi:hypothetical protein